MPCFVSKRTRKITNYYNKLSSLIDSYTDILSICNNIFEVEKLKYVIMDEDQVAIFNIRNKVHVDPKFINQSIYSKYYYFTKEMFDNMELSKIRKELLERPDKDKFNEKIVNLGR